MVTVFLLIHFLLPSKFERLFYRRLELLMSTPMRFSLVDSTANVRMIHILFCLGWNLNQNLPILNSTKQFDKQLNVSSYCGCIDGACRDVSS